MHKTVIKLLMISSLLALIACSEESFSGDAGLQKSDKIVNTATNAVEGSLLVKSTSTEADFDTILSSVGGISIVPLFPGVDNSEEIARWYELTLPEGTDLENAADILCGLDEIERVQFNTAIVKFHDSESIRTMSSEPVSPRAAMPFNDPMLSKQWHYINDGSVAATAVAGADINVKDAWRLTAGNPKVIVAIMDEGVDCTHPDLEANMWVNADEIPGNGIDDDKNGYIDDIHGYNFYDNGAIRPVDGHGTHVAGTIAAVNNNGIGVSGIAGGTGKGDGARLMTVQCFSGGASNSAVMAKGIRYAADNGACILQCSNGYQSGVFTSDNHFAKDPSFSAEAEALEYFRNKSNLPEALEGGIVIYAAGNEGKPQSSYPGGWHSNISVTAFAPDFRATGYTNYGPGCNIAAPGGEVYMGGVTYNENVGVISTYLRGSRPDGDGYPSYTTMEDGYASIQGTSMACPHVSGVAALGLSYMLELGMKCTAEEFKAMLLTSVNDIDKYHASGVKETYVFQGNSAQYKQLNLTQYRFKLGTGAIDTWKLLMQIEGTPCLLAQTGADNKIDVSTYLGGGAANMTITSVEMSDEDKEALGLTGTPKVTYGKLRIKPTKDGCAKITVKAIAGGQNADGKQEVGGGDVLGGMEITKMLSIISRGVASENGGWL